MVTNSGGDGCGAGHSRIVLSMKNSLHNGEKKKKLKKKNIPGAQDAS